MCTVSYVPVGEKVFLTSNRDEHYSRQADKIVREKNAFGQWISYPKDNKAGGTWYAVHENGTAIVLLNGAFKNHKRNPPYVKSRGIIVLETIAQAEPISYLKALDLRNIEPFTLVIYRQAALWEFRWDSVQKHLNTKNVNQPYIWSSATLYDEGAASKREALFETFTKTNKIVDNDTILVFHQTNHDHFENGFIIDLQNGLRTLSVTQAVLEKKKITLSHLNLSTRENQTVTFPQAVSFETMP